MGGKNQSHGKGGEDLEIILPIGTTLTDEDTGETIDLTDLNQKMLVCKGGQGGRGSYEMRSSTNTTPRWAEPGTDGEERRFDLNLKLIADFQTELLFGIGPYLVKVKLLQNKIEVSKILRVKTI